MFSNMALCLASAFTTGVPGGTCFNQKVISSLYQTVNCIRHCKLFLCMIKRYVPIEVEKNHMLTNYCSMDLFGR
jgi:hypothetical protein